MQSIQILSLLPCEHFLAHAEILALVRRDTPDFCGFQVAMESLAAAWFTSIGVPRHPIQRPVTWMRSLTSCLCTVSAVQIQSAFYLSDRQGINNIELL